MDRMWDLARLYAAEFLFTGGRNPDPEFPA
jgi:hypothetical protein